MHRLTIIHEDEQSCQKSTSQLLPPKQLEDTLKGLSEETTQVDILDDDSTLYHIHAGLDKGGFEHERRTHEECLKLISENVKEEDPEAVFKLALVGKYEKGFTSISIQEVDELNDFAVALQTTPVVRVDGELCDIHLTSDDDGNDIIRFSREEDGMSFESELNHAPNVLKTGFQTWSYTDTNNERCTCRLIQEEDPSNVEDTLTNILLDVLQTRGMDGVRKSLRAACVHFSENATKPTKLESKTLLSSTNFQKPF